MHLSESATAIPREAEEPLPLLWPTIGDDKSRHSSTEIFTPPGPQIPRKSDPGPLIRVTNLPAPHNGHIRILELDRPCARNAISRALLAALGVEVAAVQSQYDRDTSEELGPSDSSGLGPTRALIIASADDRSFCAGADLKERRSFTPDETASFLASLRQTLKALEDLPIPTIAAVAAPALGGGFELALATHLRVMASTAVIALPETRLGIIPGAGGTYRLASLVGKACARRLVLTGRRVSGTEAFGLGIADEVVDAGGGEARERVLEAAVGLATEICQGGPLALRMALRATCDPGEEAENAAYERVLRTSDRNEALCAFAEKRKPVFTGK